MSRAKPYWKPWIAVLFALAALLAVPAVRSGPSPQISVDYSIEGGAYDNAARVGNVTEMEYPRIAVDRDPGSSFYGTIYVAGLDHFTCGSLILSRSTDGGKTFEAPHPVFVGCLTGYLDLVVGPLGVLYAATWGATILRSTDGGTTWEILAILDPTGAPTFLTLDRTTGRVVAAWVPFDIQSPPGPILVASSQDGGVTWTQPTSILPAGTTGELEQIAARGNHVVVSFIAKGSPDPYVAATASHDGGVTWSTPTPLTEATPCMEASAPSIAVAPDGTFAVSWYADPSITTWSCNENFGNGTKTFVKYSRDGGATWSPPIHAGGPPVWATFTFGDAIAFDDRSIAYVTWHSLFGPTGVEPPTVYVASSTGPAGEFEQASFTTRLREEGGNATQLENLAAAPGNRMFLLWEVVPFGNKSSGIFVREVAGEAVGEVEGDGGLGPGPVIIDIRDPSTNTSLAAATWTGTPVTVGGLPPGGYVVWLQADGGAFRAGDMAVQSWGRTHFTVRISGVPATAFPWSLLAGLIGAGLGVVSAAVLSLHYTHLRREDVLQRKVRLLMFEYVRDHPGSSFTAVRDSLGLRNGVAAYHLGVLERQGLVHSEARRRRRWFYPNGDVSLWKELPLSPFQASLLEAVRQSPGIGVRELARAVGRRPSSVKYSLENLSREGLLRLEREGRRVRWYSKGDGGWTGQ